MIVLQGAVHVANLTSIYSEFNVDLPEEEELIEEEFILNYIEESTRFIAPHL